MCFKRQFDIDGNRAYAAEHHDNVVPEANCVLCSVPPDRILHVHDGSLFIIDSGATGNMEIGRASCRERVCLYV